MFGSVILDLFVGLLTMFLVLSILTSAINEFISRQLRVRSKELSKFIAKTLIDPTQLEKFRQSVKTTDWWGKEIFPANIKSDEFARVLYYTLNLPGDVMKLKEVVETSTVIDPELKHTITTSIEGGVTKLDDLTKEIGKWYDAKMSYLSDLYQRRSQFFLLVIATVVVFAFNVDTIAITNELLVNPSLRAVIVEQSSALLDYYEQTNAASGGDVNPDEIQSDASSTTDEQPGDDTNVTAALNLLNDLQLPIGWENAPEGLTAIKLLGLVITVLATAQGAPFWFDLLKKLSQVLKRSPENPDPAG